MFLVDGTNRNHFDTLKKATYNIARYFIRTINIAFITFGGAVDKTFGSWKTYDGIGPLIGAINALRYC